jgi:hypothetical protein
MEIKTKNVTVLINYQIILLLTHLSQSIFGLAALQDKFYAKRYSHQR